MKKSFILAVVGITLYSFSLFNGFAWDDEVYLQQTPNISQETQALSFSVYFRPAMFVINSFIFILFGHQPFFHHLTSVTFHIATAVLLFFLFKRIMKEGGAFVLSLLFLVHPGNVEAVCFASALQEILFTFTGVAGLYLLVRLKTSPSLLTISLSLILCTFALLMKETGAVFFALIFCYLLLYHRRERQGIQLYVALVIIILLTYMIVRFGGGEDMYLKTIELYPIMRVSPAIHLLNIPLIILYYLGKFFLPVSLAIGQHWVVYSPGLTTFFIPLIGEIVLLTLAVIYIFKTRNKSFTFFLLWFLIGLLPHLQLVPLNMTVAERWLYFPMIGLLGMIGSIVERLRLKVHRLLLTAILFSLFVVLSLRSYIRTRDWQSGLTLFTHDVTSTSSFDLQNNLGVELANVGKFDQSKKYILASTRLAPYWWINWFNLAVLYTREKNYPKAQECYETAIQNGGPYQLAYENLAIVLVQHGTDKQKAQKFLQKALLLFPNSEKLQMLQKNLQVK